MTSEPREELISAYVDGELSAEERTRVEQWLAESAELRQLADELRALRSSMQALPRHQLDQDLGPAVLRRAERAVLGGGADRPIAGQIQPGKSIASWWLRGAGWRRLAWPAVVAATALAIVIYDRQQQPAERQVAAAPQDELRIGAPAGAAPSPSESENLSEPGQTTADSLKQATPSEEAAPARAIEAEGLRRMRTDQAVGGAAAPATKSANAPAIGLDSAVVIDVTAEYFRDREFEKLLDAKKIVWQRDETSVFSYGMQDQKYFIEAAPKQVGQIVAEMRRDASRVKKVTPEPARPDTIEPADQSKPRRVTIVLRVLADS
jgi:hypothetical protein